MSSRAWGIIGAVGCCGCYTVLRHTSGRTVAYVFAGLVAMGWFVAYRLYRRRLARLREEFSALSAEQKEQVLKEIAPEIAEELRKQVGSQDNK